MPPSSLYWIQKSASSISSAAGNRSSAASPSERPPLALAVLGPLNSPAPIVPAVRAMGLPRKERRLISRLPVLLLFSPLSPRGPPCRPLGPLAVGVLLVS